MYLLTGVIACTVQQAHVRASAFASVVIPNKEEIASPSRRTHLHLRCKCRYQDDEDRLVMTLQWGLMRHNKRSPGRQNKSDFGFMSCYPSILRHMF